MDMLDTYLQSPLDTLVPIWSFWNNTKWCSIYGPPDAIPLAAERYQHNPLRLLHGGTSEETLLDLDYTRYPVWYIPAEHWLGYIPTEALSEPMEDPIRHLFDRRPVRLVGEYAEIYGYDEDF